MMGPGVIVSLRFGRTYLLCFDFFLGQTQTHHYSYPRGQFPSDEAASRPTDPSPIPFLLPRALVDEWPAFAELNALPGLVGRPEPYS